MAVRKNIAPTKTNLIKLKDELKFARQGYELLDQKRNILINELLTLVDLAVESEERAFAALEDAYISLEASSRDIGKLSVQSLVGSIRIDSDMSIRQRRVMGVRLPLVTTAFEDFPPYVSPDGLSLHVPSSIGNFKKALKILGELAELKVSIMRLAQEVKKTIRKVNALEKIAIPELEDSVGFIRNRLEENERESFVLMKMIKQRMEEAKNNG